IVTNSLRDPVKFWQKLQTLQAVKGPIPHSARHALHQLMPETGLSFSVRYRVSGLGSMGRPRYVALAEWQGGVIAREAKALAPSACTWAQDGRGSTSTLYQAILDHAIRCRDPFVQVRGNWLVRRLSPYCSRIELALLPKRRDEGRLLHAMGWETANVHLGSRRMWKMLRRDLTKRKSKSLRAATKGMTQTIKRDWRAWLAS